MKSITYRSSDLEAGNDEVPVAFVDGRVVKDQATFAQIGVGQGCRQCFHQTEITVDRVHTPPSVNCIFAHCFSIIKVVQGGGFEPPNLSGRIYSAVRLTTSLPLRLVGVLGLEPRTKRLKVSCSTN